MVKVKITKETRSIMGRKNTANSYEAHARGNHNLNVRMYIDNEITQAYTVFKVTGIRIDKVDGQLYVYGANDYVIMNSRLDSMTRGNVVVEVSYDYDDGWYLLIFYRTTK